MEELGYHAAVCLFDALLSALWNALVGSVAGLEVECCGPVVAWQELSAIP
jgi:hypothetical protein